MLTGDESMQYFFPTLPCGVFVFLAPSCRLILLLLLLLLPLRRLLRHHNTINFASSAQPPSTHHHHHHHHHQHNIIYANTINTQQNIKINTSSTPPQHHELCTINTTPSTHHYQHNIIYTTPSTHHQNININTAPSTQHHQLCTLNKTPSTNHHQHNIIYTTPSTHNRTSTSTHHQHIININTTPSTLHHQHNIIYTSPSTHNRTSTSTQHHQHTPSTLHLQQNNTSSSTQQHLHNTINTQQNININTWSTSTQHHQHNTINFAPSTQHHQHIITIIIIIIINTTSSTQHHQHNTICTASSALQYLSLILRGKCSTHSISVSFCVEGAALGAPPERTSVSFAWEHLQRGSQKLGDVLRSTSVGFCVAGAALGANFAWQVQHSWQVQHLEDLSVILRGRCSTRSTSSEVRGSQGTIEYCGHRLLLRGRCSTWRISVSFCVAGAAFGHSPSAKIFLHTLTIHRPTFGALVLSQPSYPFRLIPPDIPYVFLRCGLFFVLFRWPIPPLDVRRHCWHVGLSGPIIWQ